MPRRIRGSQPRRRTFLKEWREYRKLTLEAAGAELGMSAAQLSRIENTKGPYTQDLLEHAAIVYKTDVFSLLFRDPANNDALLGAIGGAIEKSR